MQHPKDKKTKIVKDVVKETVVEEEKPVIDVMADIIKGKSEAVEEVDPEFLNDFLVESKEHIENIEMNVLSLETDSTNSELIHSLFRSFHTIKGLAGFVNQDVVGKIAHQTETQLDKCRKGETKVMQVSVQ